MTSEITTREGQRIKVADLEWLPLEFICFNLREADRRDIFGQAPSDNPLEITAEIMRMTASNHGLGWSVSLNGRPNAAFGVFESHPGNWQIWSIGADDNPAVALLMLGPLLEKALPHIQAHGGHRLECKSRADRTGMRDLLGLLGFRVEGRLHRYGKDRADYLQFAYMLDDAPADMQPAAVPVTAPEIEAVA